MKPSYIPIDYQRPPAHITQDATHQSPIYYIATDARAGATQLYSVYELASGAERRLSNGSYLQDAQKIVLALRTLALHTIKPKPKS